jgi:L-lysine exporter family protein LysE/ArgO
MISQLLKGLFLGIGAAAPIGPVNFEIIRRTLKHGWAAGFALGCGAVTVDVTYALLMSLGVSHLSTHPRFFSLVQILGAALLAYLGFMSWREAIRAARNPPSIDPADALPIPVHSSYVTGLFMTFLNPMTIAFWFSAVADAVDPEHSRSQLPIICTGVFVGTLTWVVFFTATLKWLRRWRRQWWMTAADALGGTMLLGFAGYAFWTSMPRFL